MKPTSLILQLLEHLVVCGSSVMLSALFAPYGQSLGQALRDIEREASECPHDFSPHSREVVSVTLSRLKRRGLVNTRGPRKKAVWFITSRGKRHFKDIQAGDSLPVEDGKIRLVIYDIPEEMSTQRVWLRSRLLSCDYTYLQKSVWMGTRPLSAKLRDEFRVRKILPYIHVVGLDGFLNRSDKS